MVTQEVRGRHIVDYFPKTYSQLDNFKEPFSFFINSGLCLGAVFSVQI